jgi:hypothetical protein
MALAAWVALVASLWATLAGELSWQTDGFRLAVNTNGALAGITRRSDGKDVLAPGGPAYLLSLRNGGSFHASERAEWDAVSGRLTLHYAKLGATARVTIVPHPTHLTLELVEVQPAGSADAAQWGPFPTALRQTVGEVVGVVRDGGFALGLQALNPKTLGGVPENDEGNADRPYAAQATASGSVLQAYSLDRSRPRSLAVWGKRAPNMPVAPIPGETVVGSKIALFGCAEKDALATIGWIEVAEGLPHPLINGVWAKVSPERGRSYLIADYSEADIDELLGYVKRANLMSLYHGNLFKSWGHYEPNPKFFPNGEAGVKACVAKATALGIRLGAHTLSDFIQTHDAYVSPVPDPRLLRTGSSELVDAVEATAGTITVASPEYFAQEDRNELHTVVIGQELIRYRAVSREAPWRLLDCQRGAYGTTAAPHRAGASVGKLMDHSYKVFFPDLDLLREIAGNLARVFNATGLSHMDFDGHEGCLAPGQGTYGNELFAKEFHDRLDHTVINGTSPPLSHFYWHFNSYCNWGEPWYGGFRDSMQEYRINNQAFCERNYIPKMLGWYLLTPTTCLSDMEWMLARAAGFDAGFALATSPTSLRRNPETARLLDALREWENARRSGAFPAGLREQLRNPKREFHLEPIAAGAWDIFPFHDSPEFTHAQVERQPGEPTSAQWAWANPDQAQALQLKLRVVGGGGAITNAVFEVGRSAALQLPVEVRAGQTLLVEGDAIARVYDAQGRQISATPLKMRPPTVEGGTNSVQFDCEFQGEVPPKAIVTFKTKGAPERVSAPAARP